MKDLIPYILVAIMGILLYNECNKVVIKDRPYEVVKWVRDTQYVKGAVRVKRDTIKVDTTIYVDVPYIDSSKVDSVLTLYYAKNVVKDTLDVIYGKVYITDTVQTNLVQKRVIWGDFMFPSYRDTVYLAEKNGGFYLGINSLWNNGLNIGPSLMYKKNDRIYYGSVSGGNMGIVYNFGINIKL